DVTWLMPLNFEPRSLFPAGLVIDDPHAELIEIDKNLAFGADVRRRERHILRDKVNLGGEKLSSLGHGLNWRGIDEQISGICSSRSNQSCCHDLGMLDSAEFIWLSLRISAGRFNEPGLCGWIPTRRRPFV
ncbi:hypothetical protein, partial [Paraburkholderia azotifigens]